MVDELFRFQDMGRNMDWGDELERKMSKKLVYDKRLKKFVVSDGYDDPDKTIELSPEDTIVYRHV